MFFKESFIEKVREASDLHSFISQYTELQKKGSRLFGLCPYPDHQEKTPSFSVDEQRGFYHCFGCKKSGDIFTFIQDFMGLSFGESVSYLAQSLGIPISEQDVSGNFDKEIKKDLSYFKLTEASNNLFKKNLKTQSKKYLTYLEKRGLDQQIVKEFELGCALDDFKHLRNQFAEKDYLKLQELGLVKKSTKDGNFYDVFRDRVIFPIHSSQGKVVGFGGRSLTDKNQPKYLNSSDSPIFHKGKILYGLYQARKHIRSSDEAYLVEGYMDLLKVYQSGIKSVVAVLGTALTEDHLKLIKKSSLNLCFLLDSDEAGKKALERAFLMAYKQGLRPKVVDLSPFKDPDDFIQEKGKIAFKEYLKKNKEDLFIYFLNKECEDFKGEALEKLQIIEKLSPVLENMTEVLLKKFYVEELARKIEVKASDVFGKLKKSKQEFFKEKKESNNEVYANLHRAPKEEIYVLSLCLKSKEFIKQVDEDLINSVSSSGIKNLLKEIKTKQKIHKLDFISSLILQKIRPSSLILEASESEWMQKLNEKQLSVFFKDCILKIKQKKDRSFKPANIEDLKRLMKEL